MELIELECKDCGAIVKKAGVCPYMGHKYGRGWVYVCDECRGTMTYKTECEKILDIIKGDTMEMQEIWFDLSRKYDKAVKDLANGLGTFTDDQIDAAEKIIDDLRLKKNLAEVSIRREADRIHKEADDVYDVAESLSAKVKAFVSRNRFYFMAAGAVVITIIGTIGIMIA
jgi:hypothetical protein